MKSGSAAPLFRRKKFWPQIICAAILAVGGGLAGVFGSAQLFTAAILASFLGLNEFGRWPYKTNLLICAAGAVMGSIGGVFTWFETAAVFVFLFVTGGFILYYRDGVSSFVARMSALSAEISKGSTMQEVITRSYEQLNAAAQDDAVSIILTDGTENLYLENADGAPTELKRDGGAIWKVFASGRPYVTGKVDSARDRPLYRDARSMLSVPLSAGGRKLGVLQAESPRAEAYTDVDISRLEAAAFVVAQCAAPYMNAKESDQDDTD